MTVTGDTFPSLSMDRSGDKLFYNGLTGICKINTVLLIERKTVIRIDFGDFIFY